MGVSVVVVNSNPHNGGTNLVEPLRYLQNAPNLNTAAIISRGPLYLSVQPSCLPVLVLALYAGASWSSSCSLTTLPPIPTLPFMRRLSLQTLVKSLSEKLRFALFEHRRECFHVILGVMAQRLKGCGILHCVLQWRTGRFESAALAFVAPGAVLKQFLAISFALSRSLS